MIVIKIILNYPDSAAARICGAKRCSERAFPAELRHCGNGRVTSTFNSRTTQNCKDSRVDNSASPPAYVISTDSVPNAMRDRSSPHPVRTPSAPTRPGRAPVFDHRPVRELSHERGVEHGRCRIQYDNVISKTSTHTVGYRHVTEFDTPGCRKSSRSYSQQYQSTRFRPLLVIKTPWHLRPLRIDCYSSSGSRNSNSRRS